MAETLTTADAPIKLWAFYSYAASISYIFSSGDKAEFINGKYYTSDEEKALELTIQIQKHKNRSFFIKRGEETIMSDDLDPVTVLRKKHRAELMAELTQQGLLVATHQSGSTGQSEQGKLNAQSTVDLAAVAAGGDGASMGVRLAQLNKTLNPGDKE